MSGTGAAGNGSSIRRTASERFVPVNRVVTFVFAKIWKLAVGTGVPAAVGVPPVQVTTTSAIRAVSLSAFTDGGRAALIWQVCG